jgi:hypothetical protein
MKIMDSDTLKNSNSSKVLIMISSILVVSILLVVSLYLYNNTQTPATNDVPSATPTIVTLQQQQLTPADHLIRITDTGVNEPPINVKTGELVEFFNKSSFEVTVFFMDSTRTIYPGGSNGNTIETAGTYPYTINLNGTEYKDQIIVN